MIKKYKLFLESEDNLKLRLVKILMDGLKSISDFMYSDSSGRWNKDVIPNTGLSISNPNIDSDIPDSELRVIIYEVLDWTKRRSDEAIRLSRYTTPYKYSGYQKVVMSIGRLYLDLIDLVPGTIYDRPPIHKLTDSDIEDIQELMLQDFSDDGIEIESWMKPCSKFNRDERCYLYVKIKDLRVAYYNRGTTVGDVENMECYKNFLYKLDSYFDGALRTGYRHHETMEFYMPFVSVSEERIILI